MSVKIRTAAERDAMRGSRKRRAMSETEKIRQATRERATRKREGGGKGHPGPAKLTAKVTKALCRELRKGMYFSSACLAVGLNPKDAKDWMDRGTAPEGIFSAGNWKPQLPIYKEFAEAVMQAQAEAESKFLEHVGSGKQGWQGPAWVMERKMPDRWGRHEVTTIHHEIDERGRAIPIANNKTDDASDLEMLAQAKGALEFALSRERALLPAPSPEGDKSEEGVSSGGEGTEGE